MAYFQGRNVSFRKYKYTSSWIVALTVPPTLKSHDVSRNAEENDKYLWLQKLGNWACFRRGVVTWICWCDRIHGTNGLPTNLPKISTKIWVNIPVTWCLSWICVFLLKVIFVRIRSTMGWKSPWSQPPCVWEKICWFTFSIRIVSFQQNPKTSLSFLVKNGRSAFFFQEIGPIGPIERTPKPEYLIALATYGSRGPLGFGPIQFLMDFVDTQKKWMFHSTPFSRFIHWKSK